MVKQWILRQGFRNFREDVRRTLALKGVTVPTEKFLYDALAETHFQNEDDMMHVGSNPEEDVTPEWWLKKWNYISDRLVELSSSTFEEAVFMRPID